MTFLARAVATLAGLWCWALAAQAEPVAVRVCLPDIDAPPYLYRDASRLGLFDRLISDAGREAGLQVTLLRFPSARCKVALDRGEADAMPLPAVPAYMDDLDFPLGPTGKLDAAMRLGRIQFLLLRLKGEPQGWDGVRLSPPNVLVGVRRGVTTLVDRLRGLDAALDAQASTVEQLLTKLRYRRIGLAAMSREEFLAAQSSGKARDIEALVPPLISTDIHLAVSRRVPGPLRERIAAWREQLQRLQETSAYRPEDVKAPGS